MASTNTQPRSALSKNKDTDKASKNINLVYESPGERYSSQFRMAVGVITCLAFATRFWRLSYPDEVVFDEIHFGNFASYYLQRIYFFDVHPPLGKLLYAFVGWLVGYDGSFLLENIGDSYTDNKIPYIAYRSVPALLSSFTVSIIFLIMKEAGYSLPASVLAASIVLFDNAHVTLTRLIMLDAMLVFSIACAIYSYIRFHKQRYTPFSYFWWKWLFLTGIALSAVISTKYVGILTFVTIGFAMIIDLWNLLDIERGLSIRIFIRHIARRLFCLILVPFLIYLFWFYVHFKILKNSGPGDLFMTLEFEESLGNSPLPKKAHPVYYYDKITLKHIDTKTFLHSHPQRYPLRSDKERVSSQDQQVTAVPFEHPNNVWIVLHENNEEERKLKRLVRYDDKVRFLHVSTDTILLSHNAGSPLYSTNQVFTTVPLVQAMEQHPFTLFQLRPVYDKPGDIVYIKTGILHVVHVPTNVSMWTHNDMYLPEWGFGQQEIDGNPVLTHRSNNWVFDTSVNSDDPWRFASPPKVVKPMSFLKKWLELQMAMFAHNNALTANHPYSSHPILWPLTFRGIACWCNDSERKQIFFHGNILGWWLETFVLVFFASLCIADQVLLKRKFSLYNDKVRHRLYTSSGFFVLAWAVHYLPFFVMGRQLFLHHYLPAHLCLALFTGTIFDFVFGLTHQECALKQAMDGAEEPERSKDRKDKRNLKEGSFKMDNVSEHKMRQAWLITMSLVIALAGTYVYFSPLTYGEPGLSVPNILKRKVFGFQLQYTK
jgi:dolichyl-phosphate-mannose-protein mannosyltransferase